MAARRGPWRVGALLALLLCSEHGLADTLWLKNGDIISGRIVLMDSKNIAIKTSYAGSISIPRSSLKSLSTDAPVRLKQRGAAGEHVVQLSQGADGELQASHPGAAVYSLATIEYLVYPTPRDRALRFHGNLDIAADLTRKDDDEDEYDIDGDARLEHDAWRHISTFTVNHKTKNAGVVENDWDVDYILDYFLDDHFFLHSKLAMKKDEVDTLEQVRTYGAGPGYRFRDDDIGRLEFSSRFARFLIEHQGADYELNALVLSWDYRRALFGNRTEVFTTGDIGSPHTDDIDYILSGEAGVRYKLNSWLHTSLKYEFDEFYADDGDIRQSEITIGIGANW